MAETLHHFIGGARVAGTSGRFGDVFNPATGAVQARVPLAGADEVAQAVKCAADAAPAPGARHVQVQGTDRTGCG
jgi:malonate-semialdehyde dehydrogenase (acetylating)/methylmalonate-semialdehyde dehydrogenase